MLAAPMLAVAGPALVHVLSPALTFLDRVPRSRWLSFGGGVAVTLVSSRSFQSSPRGRQLSPGPSKQLWGSWAGTSTCSRWRR